MLLESLLLVFTRSSNRRTKRLVAYGLILILGLWLAGTVLVQGMLVPISHDEHQFVASGWLLANHGLLPYRDFPYFHTPYLVFAYAALFKLTSYYFLAARALNSVCAILSIIVLGAILWPRLQPLKGGWRVLVLGALPVIVIGNPLFAYSAGRAWNHSPAFLLFCLGILAHTRGFLELRRPRWQLLSGVLFGLAMGVRLTYALAAPAALASLALLPSGSRRKSRLALALLSGFGLSLLPLLLMALLWPGSVTFGNLVYPSLNTTYRAILSHGVVTSATSKLRALWGVYALSLPNLLPALACASVLGGSVVVGLKKGLRSTVGIWAASAFLASLIVGALAPTPAWEQYFFEPQIFMILIALLGICSLSLPAFRLPRGLGAAWLAGLTLVGAIYIAFHLPLAFWRTPARVWVPVETHRLGTLLRARIGSGRVLTLAPIVPLEGGLDIYPQLATGPFAWRVAPLMADQKLASLKMPDPDDLAVTLAAHPPAAVLTGFESQNAGFARGGPGGLEGPLAMYASTRGFTPHSLGTPVVKFPITIWVSRDRRSTKTFGR